MMLEAERAQKEMAAEETQLTSMSRFNQRPPFFSISDEFDSAAFQTHSTMNRDICCFGYEELRFVRAETDLAGGLYPARSKFSTPAPHTCFLSGHLITPSPMRDEVCT